MSSPAIWTHPLCWRWNRSSRSNRWQRNLRLPKPRVGARARRIIHLSRSEPVKLSDRRIPVGERSAETNPDGRRWDTNLRREGARAKKRTRSDRISTKIGFIHKLSAGEQPCSSFCVRCTRPAAKHAAVLGAVNDAACAEAPSPAALARSDLSRRAGEV